MKSIKINMNDEAVKKALLKEIDEARVAAENELLWSKGEADVELSFQHLQNSNENTEWADALERALKKGIIECKTENHEFWADELIKTIG